MSHILQKVAPIGESRDRELLKSASSYVYASHDGVDLLAHVFFPTRGERSQLPVVACFHGGFWDSAMATQFVPHCHHFASRDAVAITFEYRVSSRTGTGPVEALEDAKAAIQWLCENADVLGIDTDRIAVVGAAGGAWLALDLIMPKDKDLSVPVRPRVAVLFSALVNTGPKGRLSERFPDVKAAKALSPLAAMRRKLPPMLFIHGKSDRQAPYEEVVTFCRKSRWRRNRCELVDYTGADHSFFNFNVHHGNFEMTLATADRFLTETGVLNPAPEVEEEED